MWLERQAEGTDKLTNKCINICITYKTKKTMDKQKDKPLYVAFSTQKGGAGKTTLTVLVASYLHYVKGYNVAVIDSDFPQYSIHEMRKRDIDRISKDDYYNVQLTRSVSLLPVCRVAGVRGTKSIQIMSVKYKLYQDNRSNSKFKGQWYARAVVMDAVHLEDQHRNSGKHVGEAGRCVCRAERTGERDEPPPEERRPRGARRLWVV